MKDLFFEFLEKNGATEGFKDLFRLRVTTSGSRYKSIDEYLEDDDPDGWVLGIFTWELSVEGHDYWSDLNKKWEAIVLNNETK